MEGWVIDTLKANGLAGAFIMILLGAIAVLWRMIQSKDRQLKELHAQRAVERETLVRLVEGANTAANATADVTERRNDIMSNLGTAILSQANAVERYEDRVTQQAEMLKEKFADFRHVVDSFGESNRVVSGLIAEVRNAVVKLESAINQIAVSVAAAASRGQ